MREQLVRAWHLFTTLVALGLLACEHKQHQRKIQQLYRFIPRIETKHRAATLEHRLSIECYFFCTHFRVIQGVTVSEDVTRLFSPAAT